MRSLGSQLTPRESKKAIGQHHTSAAQNGLYARAPPMDARPRIIYVSYDGATEPLGRSQVLSYLERLAADFDITLISFEKERARREDRLAIERAGLRWLPQHYHRKPPVVSTAYDIARGAAVLARELKRQPAALIHTRS